MDSKTVPSDAKLCGVCGDKALGFNFNAITCESCKAFFRRNALKTKEFSCPFERNCKIDPVTRRICQKCRLAKCFEIGMKKEYIMTDEEKLMKKQKIEKNRQKRKVYDYDVGSNDVKVGRLSVDNNFQTDVDETLSCSNSNSSSNGNLTNLAGNMNPTESSCDILTLNGTSPGQHPLANELISSIITQSPAYQDLLRTTSNILSNQVFPGAMMKPNYAPERPPNCCASNSVPCTAIPEQYPKVEKYQEVQMPDIWPTLGSCANEPTKHDVGCQVPEFNTWENRPQYRSPFDNILDLAIKAEYSAPMGNDRENEMASLQLNEIENAKLNELVLASNALHEPMEDDIAVLTNVRANEYITAMTDFGVRRLIKMTKKIGAFRKLCQEDQVALLKGSCTELLALRSVMSYDPNRDSWKIPHSDVQFIKLDILKEVQEDMYLELRNYIYSFDPKWRSDENIMLIMCAIIIFTPERHNVVHRDAVKLGQDSYFYLLRRYLESIYPGCEARSVYLKLIQKILELRAFHERHIMKFLQMNPVEAEPLLIEIFDMYQR